MLGENAERRRVAPISSAQPGAVVYGRQFTVAMESDLRFGDKCGHSAWAAELQIRQSRFRCPPCEARSNVHNLARTGAVEIAVALFVGAMESRDEVSVEWHVQFVGLSGITHVDRPVDFDGAARKTLNAHLLAAF